MKFSAATVSLATLVLAVAATAADAADMHGQTPGGMKGYGNGVVSVPAPIPYEDTYKWYLRGDLGFALKSSGPVSVSGLPLDVNEPSEWSPRGFVSVGFGRYITPSLRAEFTVDMRGNRRIIEGTHSTQYTMSQTVGTQTGTNVYDVSRDDNFAHQNSTFLLSAFYDINREGRFRPYVGAGLGIAMHQIERTTSETAVCNNTLSTTVDTVGPLTTIGCSTVGTLPAGYALAQSTDNKIGVGLAAQLSAGVSYALTPRTHWDTGYRMLWQSGNVAVTTGSIAGSSTIRIGNRFDHELRTGLRFDIW